MTNGTLEKDTVLVRLAHISDVPLGEGRAVRAGRTRIALFHTREGFRAIQNDCPHKGGPLADGILTGCKVYCPLHNQAFDLLSGKGDEGATMDVTVYPIEESDGYLFIHIAKEEI